MLSSVALAFSVFATLVPVAITKLSVRVCPVVSVELTTSVVVVPAARLVVRDTAPPALTAKPPVAPTLP